MLKDIKSTVKNSVIYGLANLCNKAAGLILMPIYTKYLTQFEFGANALLTITTNLLIAFFGFGLSQGFFRWYWDKEFLDKQKSMFYTITFASIVIVILMLLVSLPFLKNISLLLMDSNEYPYVIFLVFFSAALEIILLMPNSLIRLQEKPTLFTVSSILRLSVSISLTVYFLIYKGKNLDGILEAIIISQFVYIIVLSKYTLKNIEIKFELQILKDLFLFSFPICLSSIAAMILLSIDRYALKFLSSVDDVALYTPGFLISNVAFLFIVSVNSALMPMIFKKMGDANSKRFYSKVMTYYSFVLMILILVISFYSQELITLITTKTYWDSYKFIPILNLGVFFIMLKDVSYTGIFVVKKTKIIATIIVGLSIINLGLDLLLIPYLKSFGAAIAYLLTQILYFIVVFHFSQKYFPIPYEFKKIIKILIVGITLYLLVFLISDLNLYFRLIIKTILIFLYPVILYYVKFFDKVELDAIQNGWIKWKNPGKWKDNIKKIKLN